MWWAADTGLDFKSSGVCKNVGIYLNILDHHHSYALGILSFAFGLKQDNLRTRLPDKDLIAFEGQEGVEIMISLSESCGIHFHFPVSPRYKRYRNNFIRVYVNFCYNIRAQILSMIFLKMISGSHLRLTGTISFSKKQIATMGELLLLVLF